MICLSLTVSHVESINNKDTHTNTHTHTKTDTLKIYIIIN